MKIKIIETAIMMAIALVVLMGMITLQKWIFYKNCSMMSSKFCEKILNNKR